MRNTMPEEKKSVKEAAAHFCIAKNKLANFAMIIALKCTVCYEKRIYFILLLLCHEVAFTSCENGKRLLPYRAFLN